jgi:hypothetical protein
VRRRVFVTVTTSVRRWDFVTATRVTVTKTQSPYRITFAKFGTTDGTTQKSPHMLSSILRHQGCGTAVKWSSEIVTVSRPEYLNSRQLLDLAEDWQQHGREVLTRVRRESPATYLKVCAHLVPKEFQVEYRGGVKAMTDEQLEAGIEALTRMIEGGEAGANAKVVEGLPQPIEALPAPDVVPEGPNKAMDAATPRLDRGSANPEKAGCHRPRDRDLKAWRLGRAVTCGELWVAENNRAFEPELPARQGPVGRSSTRHGWERSRYAFAVASSAPGSGCSASRSRRPGSSSRRDARSGHTFGRSP